MVQIVELRLSVTEAAGLGEAAEIAATVHLPDVKGLTSNPVVCFAKPGAGYSRKYFTCDLPGPGRGSQAEWHTQHGWIFVSVDYLGAGDSSIRDWARLNYTVVAAANQAAEVQLLQLLARGALQPGFPKIVDPIKIGIGQSTGGCLTVIQQARYQLYDGIGILGFSAVHTRVITRPDKPKLVAPLFPHGTKFGDPGVSPLNRLELSQAEAVLGLGDYGPAMSWGFYWDDIDPKIVAADNARYQDNAKTVEIPEWCSATRPYAVCLTSLTPGTIAPEAAAITTPVVG